MQQLKLLHLLPHNSVLEEKATACQMLCCYAEELREGFLPWVEPVTQIMLPLLKFYFHEEARNPGLSLRSQLQNFEFLHSFSALNVTPEAFVQLKVRRSAVIILPELFLSGKAAVAAGQRPQAWRAGPPNSLLSALWSPLLEALHKEPEPDLASQMLSSLAQIVEAAGNLMAGEQLMGLTEELKHQLERSSERRRERQVGAGDQVALLFFLVQDSR